MVREAIEKMLYTVNTLFLAKVKPKAHLLCEELGLQNLARGKQTIEGVSQEVFFA